MNRLFSHLAVSTCFASLVACGGSKGRSTSDNLNPTPFHRVASLEELSNLSRLGNDKGNGGDVLVCFATRSIQTDVRNKLGRDEVNPFSEPNVLNDITKIQMLDVYEYLLPVGFPPTTRSLMPIDNDLVVAIEKAIQRAESKTSFGKVLRQTLAYMPLSNWTEAPGIPEINDSNHATFPPSECLIVQMAVRRDNLVYYDKFLFSKLDAVNRLALVMHELVYKIAADKGHTNSSVSRQVVGKLLSGSEFDAMTTLDLHLYLKAIDQFPFPFEIEGNSVWAKTVIMKDEDGGPFVGVVELLENTELVLSGSRYQAHAKSPIEIDRHGKVAKLVCQSMGNKFNWDNVGTLQIGKVNIVSNFSGEFATFSTSDFQARASKVVFDEAQILELRGNFVKDGNQFGMEGFGEARFHPNSKLLAEFIGRSRVRVPNSVIESRRVSFHQNGAPFEFEGARALPLVRGESCGSVCSYAWASNDQKVRFQAAITDASISFDNLGRLRKLKVVAHYSEDVSWAWGPSSSHTLGRHSLFDVTNATFDENGLITEAEFGAAGKMHTLGEAQTVDLKNQRVKFCGAVPELCKEGF